MTSSLPSSSTTSAWATPTAANTTWATPLCNAEQEEKFRTLTFGNWPRGTESSKIKAFIDNHFKDYVGDLDEDGGTFAFGKETATRGAARFKTPALMLKYTRRRGNAAVSLVYPFGSSIQMYQV